MNIQSTARRAALTVAAAAAALSAVPVAASAQSYGSAYDRNGQYYYDGCRRDQNSRAVVGGLIGGLAGMAAGNNLSDRRSHRREGAVAGTLLGALAGSQIGKSTAGCVAEPRPQTYRYNNYSSGYAYTPDYGSRYGSGYGYQDDDYYYDRYAEAPSYSYGQSYDYGRPPLACTYTESPVRMPDGRTQKRMVQVCPDRNGRYQIVD